MTTEVSTRQDSVSHPCVRNACEECHNRKIRCHISNGGGSCQACTNNGRLCFFLPRYKSGRPKATDQNGNKITGTSRSSPTHSSKTITTAAAAAAKKLQNANNNNNTPSQPILSKTASTHSITTYGPVRGMSSNPTPVHSSTPTRQASPSLTCSLNTDTQMSFADLNSPLDDWQAHDLSHYTSYSLSPFEHDPYGSYKDLTRAQNDSQYEFRMHQDLPSSHLHGVSGMGMNINGSMSFDTPLSTTTSNFSYNMPFNPSSYPSTPIGMPGTPAPPGLSHSIPGSSSATSRKMSMHSVLGIEDYFTTLLNHINRLQRDLDRLRSTPLLNSLNTNPYTSYQQSSLLESILSDVDAGCLVTCNTLKAQCQAILSTPTPNYSTSPLDDPNLTSVNGGTCFGPATTNNYPPSSSSMSASSSSTGVNPNQSPSVDNALIALSVTSVLKIAELCDALITRHLCSTAVSSPSSSSASSSPKSTPTTATAGRMSSATPELNLTLDKILLFKRLECNVLQTRIALSSIESLDTGLNYLVEDANKKVIAVERRFESLRGGSSTSSARYTGFGFGAKTEMD